MRQMLGLLGVRVPQFELEEIIQLSSLLVARMEALEPDADQRHEAWVASRFRYPLRSLLIKANGSSVAYVVLTLVVVAGGFATSGIAAAAGAGKGTSTTTAWVVFGIRLLVALAGAISQQFRFGTRSSERRTLAVALREEG